MKRGEQDSKQVKSTVGVMRPLIHILQIMQSREVTNCSAYPVGTERRTQPTFMKRWMER